MVTTAISEHARLTPDRNAVVYNNVAISYRRFAWFIDTSMRHLAAQGLGGSGVAVLLMSNIFDAWIQGLALRCLGMTIVVVQSLEEIGRLGLPDITCVVTTEISHHPTIAAHSAAAGWRYVCVPRAIYADATPHASLAPNLPAARGGHILLTSGTTGSHKKILIDPVAERAISDFIQQAFEISERSVTNLFHFGGWAGMGFKMAVSTWDPGGCVVLNEGPNLHEALRYRGITHTFATPQVLADVLAAPASELQRNDGMRLFVTAGPLPAAMARDAKARLTSRLYTHVGATEAPTFTLTPIVEAEDLRWHRILGSRAVEIVDDADRVVPAGQEGIIRVATLGGVTFYLHDEELSRAYFRDGYFYPGDLGVIRADGRLALQGRVTEVINVLGQKIAVGPIEERLQQKLCVTGACVFSMPSEDGEEIIYVTIESPQPVARDAVIAELDALLPGRSRALIGCVTALPRNAMGKIQRDVLRQRLRRAG